MTAVLEASEVIKFYEAASSLARAMCLAARSGDDDLFALAEARYASHVGQLRAVTLIRLDGELARRKLTLVRQLLAYDREIRDLTDSYPQILRAALSGQTTRHC